MRSLAYGFTLPFRAGKLIVKTPSLLFWSVLPVLLTLSLYGFVVIRLQELARGAVIKQFMAWGLNEHGVGVWILTIAVQLILLLVGAFTFSAAASVIASPFNDFLAEKTEKYAKPALPPVRAIGFRAKLRLILIDLGKAMAAAVATLLAFLMSWVPIVNLFVFALAFLLVTFQYISYPQTRRGLGIREGLRFLVRHPLACLGFGACLSVMFAIPFLSSLCFPMAVVGGTLLVARAQGQPRLR